MIKSYLIAGVSILSFICAGCATDGYWFDRQKDFADIFTCTAGLGVGAKLRLGPINIGLPVAYAVDKVGLKNGMVGKFDHNNYTPDNQDTWLLLLGFQYEVTADKYQRGKSYAVYTASSNRQIGLMGGPEQYSQLEFLWGLVGTVRLGFNPGELIDFFLGWFLLDVYDDDFWLKTSHQRTISFSCSGHKKPRLLKSNVR